MAILRSDNDIKRPHILLVLGFEYTNRLVPREVGALQSSLIPKGHLHLDTQLLPIAPHIELGQLDGKWEYVVWSKIALENPFRFL